MFIFLLILLYFKSSSCHVCRTSVLRVRDVPETYHYTYYEAYQGADCLIWCTKSRLVTKTGIRMVQKMFNEFVDECCDGYEQDKTNTIICQPTCDPPCKNGICQKPNQCTCNSGYIIDANNKNTCIQHEPNNNSNESNNDPNNSNCPVIPDCEYNNNRDGTYDTTNISTLEDDYYCTLHIKERCCNNIHAINSDLEKENIDTSSSDIVINYSEADDKENNSAPNGEDSYLDYYQDSSEPSCSDECHNCKCVADETWICDPGWYFNVDKTECLPHCDACVNGICKAPNICECFEGYHLSKLPTASCIPDCNCSEGCLIPNVCMNKSKCEKCETKCSDEVVTPDVGVIKPIEVEEIGLSKSTSNNEENMNFIDPVEIDVKSQKTVKENINNTETKLSGIPIYFVYIAAAIGLIFLIVLVILIKKKINSKFRNKRKFSFVDGAAGDINNMTVHYKTNN